MKRRHVAKHSAGWAVLCLVVAAGCKTTGTSVTESPPASLDDSQAPIASEAEPMETGDPGLQPVYFEYDRWHLTDRARRTLRSNAERIAQSPELGVLTIEGHCDERGSAEYNLVLGERRATAVRRYLEDLGLPSSRFETVSFGESRPAVPGHGESAWRHNRRSELRSDQLQVSDR